MRYYGSKEKVLDLIEKGVKKTELNHGAKFVDLFSGTTVVSQHFKKLGYTVIANDFLEFSHAMAKTYIEISEPLKFNGLKKEINLDLLPDEAVVNYLNQLSPKRGFIFQNYSPGGTAKRKYFSNENGQKIDSIRETIEIWKNSSRINNNEYYFLITALLEAVNLVSNVAGTYGAFLKTWDARALKKIKLTPPKIILSKRNNLAFRQDANKLGKKVHADILYLDPPYNNRQYASNYFLLELIAEGWFKEKPKITGVTGVREYSHQLSDYSYNGKAKKALEDLITHSKAKYILLSYNDEGIIQDSEIRKILSKAGSVQVISKFHKRYQSINQKDTDRKVTSERLYIVETPSAKKRANKLDGNTWLRYSFSIWRDIRKNSEEKKLKHPAIFPVQLAERLIEIFTNGSNKTILDPFAGSGSTLIAGLKKGMKVIGLDISKEFQNLFFSRMNSDYRNLVDKKRIKYYLKDAREITKYVDRNSVDLCITSPPYWDVLNARRSADLKRGRNYTSLTKDIGNIDSYRAFLGELSTIMEGVYKTIVPNGYAIVVVMDIRKGSNFFSFHNDIERMMKNIGFTFEDLLIWDRQKEYNNMKPLGYPYKFIVNKVHEYILIFRKNGPLK